MDPQRSEVAQQQLAREPVANAPNRVRRGLLCRAVAARPTRPHSAYAGTASSSGSSTKATAFPTGHGLPPNTTMHQVVLADEFRLPQSSEKQT